MIKYLLAIFLFILGSAHADSFLSNCLTQKSTKNLFSQLKLDFKSKNCFELNTKIQTIKSLSEIYSPATSYFSRSKNHRSWTYSFPYMYGLMDFELAKSKSISYNQFQHSSEFEVFSTLKNIQHLTYTDDYQYTKKYSLCNMIAIFPYLNEITLNTEELKNPESDSCISRRNINVIIRDQFEGFTVMPKSKIIGFEEYRADFASLANFPYLRYLGVSEYYESQGEISALSGRYNLTHLSLNINNIQKVENISKLVNLTYLSLYCQQIAIDDGPMMGCTNRKLEKINFLEKLRWLEFLYLSHNKIEDITPVLKFKYLKRLELADNRIQFLPDLSSLAHLSVLDLRNNYLEGFSISTVLPSLEQLDISENMISNFSGLIKLPNLKYLNIARTSAFNSFNAIKFPKTLRILDISGYGTGKRKDQLFFSAAFSKTEIYTKNPNALFDFLADPADALNYIETPTSPEKISLDLPELEVLISNFNHLKYLPDTSKLTKLKILKLEYNQIENLPLIILAPQLVSLDLTGNKLARFPNLQSLKNLSFIDVIGNNMSDLKNVSYLPNYSYIGISDNNISKLTDWDHLTLKGAEFDHGYSPR